MPEGDGLGGVGMYQSKAESPAAGFRKPTFRPPSRYSGVGVTVQPEAHPEGHDCSRSQRSAPVR